MIAAKAWRGRGHDLGRMSVRDPVRVFATYSAMLADAAPAARRPRYRDAPSGP